MFRAQRCCTVVFVGLALIAGIAMAFGPPASGQGGDIALVGGTITINKTVVGIAGCEAQPTSTAVAPTSTQVPPTATAVAPTATPAPEITVIVDPEPSTPTPVITVGPATPVAPTSTPAPEITVIVDPEPSTPTPVITVGPATPVEVSTVGPPTATPTVIIVIVDPEPSTPTPVITVGPATPVPEAAVLEYDAISISEPDPPETSEPEAGPCSIDNVPIVFDFSVDCVNDNYDAVIQVPAWAGTADYELNAPNDCIVSEVVSEDWVLSTPNDVVCNLTYTETECVVDFTNTYAPASQDDTGIVFVTKYVADGDQPNEAFGFTITCDDGQAFEAALWPGETWSYDALAVGTSCAVTEDVPEGWTLVSPPNGSTVDSCTTGPLVRFDPEVCTLRFENELGTGFTSTTPTPGASVTPGPSVTASPTSTVVATVTPDPSVTASPTSTVGATVTPDPNATASPTSMVSPSVTAVVNTTPATSTPVYAGSYDYSGPYSSSPSTRAPAAQTTDRSVSGRTTLALTGSEIEGLAAASFGLLLVGGGLVLVARISRRQTR